MENEKLRIGVACSFQELCSFVFLLLLSLFSIHKHPTTHKRKKIRLVFYIYIYLNHYILYVVSFFIYYDPHPFMWTMGIQIVE